MNGLLWSLWPKEGAAIKPMSARDAKHQFGRLIDTARAEPVVVEKHGRPVVVVLAGEEFERLKALSELDRQATKSVGKGD